MLQCVGVIYALLCNTTGLQYIGSTATRNKLLVNHALEKRYNLHISDFKRYGMNSPMSARFVLENGNSSIHLLEVMENVSIAMIRRREGQYIKENIGKVVNVNIPWGIERVERKEYIKEYAKRIVKCKICQKEMMRTSIKHHLVFVHEFDPIPLKKNQLKFHYDFLDLGAIDDEREFINGPALCV